MKVLEKTERRLGEKLFLKGERCLGAKCAAVRRPYPPGVHGKGKKRGGRGGGSEFGIQLKEKQKVRVGYGLRERMLERYFHEALLDKKHPTGEALINLLERRLDNILFRAGFTVSRSIARHLVGHGHVLVNKRPVNRPSYSVRGGDIIEFVPKILGNEQLAGELPYRLKKIQPPDWLKIDVEKKTIEILREPYEAGLEINPNITLVVEYYSR